MAEPVFPWHMLTIDHEMTADGFIITITTNRACHCYLRYSKVYPRIHRKSVLRRGVVFGWDARFCFVSYQHLEQDEEGDTYIHTFTWPGWENCHTRYFYFFATVGGFPGVSDSPIFWLHYLWIAPPPMVYFYPDAHPETTSVDGGVWRINPSPYGDWATIRDGPGTNFGDAAATMQVYIYAYYPPNTYVNIYRSILLFDTTIIPPGATIHAAELRLYGHSKVVHPSWGAAALSVVSSLPTLNYQLQPSDYGTLGGIALSDTILMNDIVAGGHNLFTFNPAGLAAITKEGITKLGIREDTWDRANIPPPLVAYAYAQAIFRTSESADIEWRPRLGVSYS